MHLSWLDPRNLSGNDRVLDYPDLFRECGDGLLGAGLYDQALEFYLALTSTDYQLDASLHLQIGKCQLRQNQMSEAKASFLTSIQLDDANVEARVQLAKLHEILNEKEEAFVYLNEVMKLKRAENRQHDNYRRGEVDSPTGHTFMPARTTPRPNYTTSRLMSKEEQAREEVLKNERVQELYKIMCLEQDGMRSGDYDCSRRWMEAAGTVIDDFRSVKDFYPWDKYVHFLGYSRPTGPGQSSAGTELLDDELVHMATRLTDRK